MPGAYRSFRSLLGEFSQIHWMQVVLMEYRNSPLRTFVTQKNWTYVLCEAISSLPAKACILTQFSQFILWVKMAAAPSDSAAPRRACDLARNTKSEWFWEDTPKDTKRPGKNKWLYNEHFKEAKFGGIQCTVSSLLSLLPSPCNSLISQTFTLKFPDSQHRKVRKLPVSWRKWSASRHGHCSD